MVEPKALSLFWEGFELHDYSELSEDSLLLRLQPRADRRPRCSGCGQSCSRVHDTTLRRVRERDLFDRRVWLDVPVRRVSCAQCGVRVEWVTWLAGRRALTVAMVRYVEALARLLPVRQVAELLGLHWDTVKAIDQQRLHREVVEPDRTRLRRLIMDEFALYKGHRYATVVACADTQQVLWVGEGRSREAIRPFFTWLGEACDHIEAVAMEMNAAMHLEVQAHCPNAAVIYDLFHVVAKFGREVIDRVRVDQRSEEHTSESSHVKISYAVFCLKKKKKKKI